jgi:UPF0271 protein
VARGTIDLNGDVGEGFDDGPFIELLTSVNVACGAHAGDEATIEQTIRLATAAGAAIGAHPGYPDRDGFGRRELPMSPSEVEASVLEQVRAVDRVARRRGAELRHVKAHGALYNRAALDPGLAAAIAHAVRVASDRLAVVGPPGSALLRAAEAEGLRGLAEAFADRAYEPDGTLRSRALDGAVLTDPEAVASQAVSIARDGRVTAFDGSALPIQADTICLHGDTPGSLDNARAVRAALDAAGIVVATATAAGR